MIGLKLTNFEIPRGLRLQLGSTLYLDYPRYREEDFYSRFNLSYGVTGCRGEKRLTREELVAWQERWAVNTNEEDAPLDDYSPEKNAADAEGFDSVASIRSETANNAKPFNRLVRTAAGASADSAKKVRGNKKLGLVIGIAAAVLLLLVGLILFPRGKTAVDLPDDSARERSSAHAKTSSSANGNALLVPIEDLSVGNWIDSIRVGDILAFGHYEQNGDASDGAEPIRWLVLDKDGSRVLLLSQQCLEGMPFHSERSEVCWQDSYLREWLNSDFLQSAFDDNERGLIEASLIKNPQNLTYNTGNRENSVDSVFLLSYTEWRQYFPSETNAAADSTEHAKKTGAFVKNTNGNTWWWLRTSGIDLEHAEYVYSYGALDQKGDAVSAQVGGVRPALWADLSRLSAPESLVRKNLCVDLKSAKAGDIVLFGRYETDNNANNGFEDLEWIVLARDDNRLLLLSRYCIDALPYHHSREDITWSNCTLRSWLNDDFKETAFTFEEQSCLIMTSCAGGSQEYKYGSKTVDEIFLLSPDEVQQYLPSEVSRRAVSTPYAVSRGVFVKAQTGLTWWWLRVPGEDLVHAAYVYSYGSLDLNGDVVTSAKGGVRPAIWIKVC